MAGNKHKQIKKKPARVVRETKNNKKKDLGGPAEGAQTDPSQDKEAGHCCLPVGKTVHINPHTYD